MNYFVFSILLMSLGATTCIPMSTTMTLRVGCGAGFSGDRWDGAVPVVRTLRAAGGPAVLIFETLAERTLALAQLRRRADPDAGWEPSLERFVAPVLRDCVDAGIPIVGNFGAANPAGAAYIDRGVGDMLRSANNPNPDWVVLAPQFDGKFRVPTLRNVDLRPYPTFVKAYMHNGYLKSLKEVVHFYNTRDKFPHCPQGSPGEKVTCWPAPEVLANLDMTVGNLGLTDEEENEIVAFMQTLTDGYFKP